MPRTRCGRSRTRTRGSAARAAGQPASRAHVSHCGPGSCSRPWACRGSPRVAGSTGRPGYPATGPALETRTGEVVRRCGARWVCRSARRRATTAERAVHPSPRGSVEAYRSARPPLRDAVSTPWRWTSSVTRRSAAGAPARSSARSAAEVVGAVEQQLGREQPGDPAPDDEDVAHPRRRSAATRSDATRPRPRRAARPPSGEDRRPRADLAGQQVAADERAGVPDEQRGRDDRPAAAPPADPAPRGATDEDGPAQGADVGGLGDREAGDEGAGGDDGGGQHRAGAGGPARRGVPWGSCPWSGSCPQGRQGRVVPGRGHPVPGAGAEHAPLAAGPRPGRDEELVRSTGRRALRLHRQVDERAGRGRRRPRAGRAARGPRAGRRGAGTATSPSATAR